MQTSLINTIFYILEAMFLPLFSDLDHYDAHGMW